MSLRTRTLPALYNGVSQQPPILRSSDQQQEELNTWAALANGVGKRPPTEFLSAVNGQILENTYIHYINRDVSERYVVLITPEGVRVFEHDTGIEKTVNAPGGFGYLTDGKFRAVTVADYTFIVNTEKKCEMAALGSDATYDPDYYRWLNNRPVNAEGNLYIGLGYTDFFSGRRMQYAPNQGDGLYSGEVPSIEKLPETAANGTMYKVTGSIDTGFVSFYVRRNGAVWDETVANGLVNAISAPSMPHCLVREADGTFTFAPFSWQNRRVGDQNTNPNPTFIGRSIKDVFFYQNRIGFLVDENVVFSCTGDFGNFWRNSSLDYVATDVIDVAVTTSNVALLQYALPFNNGIVVFSDQTQFSLSNSEEGLSPESIAIRPVTTYEVNSKVRPVTIGSEIYYCGDVNGSSIVWEYTRQDGSDGLSAAEITAHCPSYIPAGLTKLVAAPNAKALFAITGTGLVYVYQFYWNGNEKAQSAWRKWDIGDPVISAEYIDGYVYMLINRPGGLQLERIHLEQNAKPVEQTFQVHLDRRVKLNGIYEPVTGRTYYTLPYSANQAKIRVIRDKFHPTAPGSLVNPATYQWTSPTTFSVLGQGIGDVTVGELYEQYFEFSRQFPQDYQQRPISTGRLQLRTFTVYFDNTGFFRTLVSPYGNATEPQVEEVIPAKIADFTGKVVGSSDLMLSRPSFQTGSYSFQVYGDAAQCVIALSNDTHVGATFVSAEWEGLYFNRALR